MQSYPKIVSQRLRAIVTSSLRAGSILAITAALTGCFSKPTEALDLQSSSDGKTRTFSTCVVSQEDVERTLEARPTDRERYEDYLSEFDFNEERQCYEQHWTVPIPVRPLLTGVGRGQDHMRFIFPSLIQGKHQGYEYPVELKGMQVVVRSIASSPNFAAAKKFRREQYPVKTAQLFKHYQVWEYKPGHIRKALTDPEGTELNALLLLKDGSQPVSAQNAEWVSVESNLDDKFELHYGLQTRRLDEIEQINKDITAVIRSYLSGQKQ